MRRMAWEVATPRVKHSYPVVDRLVEVEDGRAGVAWRREGAGVFAELRPRGPGGEAAPATTRTLRLARLGNAPEVELAYRVGNVAIQFVRGEF